MINLIFLLVALVSCIIGKICGMGGGVIIKPVLDATGTMSVAAINFISGCTVLGMTAFSVGKSFKEKDTVIDLKISTPLAIGAAFGGVFGKQLFSMVQGAMPQPEKAGAVQAILLLTATCATLIYTIFKNRIASKDVTNIVACLLIGLGLGMLGAFLGIGGGPFNMAVLFYFFSMPTKKAAQNSLYIILISQAASLLITIFSNSVPEVSALLLAGMVLFGVLGSETGSRINKRLSEKGATYLFEGAMILVMGISIYNIIQFW